MICLGYDDYGRGRNFNIPGPDFNGMTFAVRSEFKFPGPQGGNKGRVSRQNAQVTFRTGRHHGGGHTAKDNRGGRNDFKPEFSR